MDGSLVEFNDWIDEMEVEEMPWVKEFHMV